MLSLKIARAEFELLYMLFRYRLSRSSLDEKDEEIQKRQDAEISAAGTHKHPPFSCFRYAVTVRNCAPLCCLHHILHLYKTQCLFPCGSSRLQTNGINTKLPRRYAMRNSSPWHPQGAHRKQVSCRRSGRFRTVSMHCVKLPTAGTHANCLKSLFLLS